MESAEPTARRSPAAVRMVSWSGEGARRLEAARIVLGERGMRASGSLISADGADSHTAGYTLTVDETGVLSRLTVRVVTATGERHVSLSRSEEGIWLVDHGDGTSRSTLDGALDIDLQTSVLFNALPLRRTGVHRVAGEQEIGVVRVGLPSLEVKLLRQTYRTVSVGDAGVPSVVAHGVGADVRELTVDADGIVVDFPGLAQRC